MNCRELTTILVDHLDNELPQAKRDECHRHLANCADCSAYLAAYQATVRLARAAYQADKPLSTNSVNALIDRLSIWPVHHKETTDEPT